MKGFGTTTLVDAAAVELVETDTDDGVQDEKKAPAVLAARGVVGVDG